MENGTFAEGTTVTHGTAYDKGGIWSLKEDSTEGNNWGYFRYATINWQTATKYSTQAGAWKVNITNAERNSVCSVPLKLAEIAVVAAKLVTVKAWVKKDHATNIACKLISYADVTLAYAEASATKGSADTNWEELTITFTPTNKGVADIFLESWWVAGSSSVYVGTISVTQAP